MMWKWLLALLIIATVVGGTVISATKAYTSVRIMARGTIKTSSAVNASVSIPSYGIINYEPKDLQKGEQTIRDSLSPKEESLNISEPKGLTKPEPR